MDAFRRGLAETGYFEGQNVAIEYRMAGAAMKTDEAQRQRRRENAGKRLKLCSRCNQRLAHHRVKDDRLCCECYVAAGNKPADWHPDCMAAAAALGKTQQ